jgi:hypothetical protein
LSVNIPITVLAIFLRVVAVRESRDETAGRHVDLVGLVTITTGLTTLVLAIHQSDSSGWESPVVISPLVAAVVLLTMFVLVEPRMHEPLIELDLFGNRSYLGAKDLRLRREIIFFLPPILPERARLLAAEHQPRLLLAFAVTFTVCDTLAGPVAGVTGARLPIGRHGVERGGLPLVSPDHAHDLALRGPGRGARGCGRGQAFAYAVLTAEGMAAIP